MSRRYHCPPSRHFNFVYLILSWYFLFSRVYLKIHRYETSEQSRAAEQQLNLTTNNMSFLQFDLDQMLHNFLKCCLLSAGHKKSCKTIT